MYLAHSCLHLLHHLLFLGSVVELTFSFTDIHNSTGMSSLFMVLCCLNCRILWMQTSGCVIFKHRFILWALQHLVNVFVLASGLKIVFFLCDVSFYSEHRYITFFTNCEDLILPACVESLLNSSCLFLLLLFIITVLLLLYC